MAIKLLGFNFKKISVERLSSSVKEGIKTNTNINISEIKDLKQDEFKTKNDLIGVEFVYSVDYSPDFAKVELKGNLILSIESKDSKKILKDWKDQKLDEDFKYKLFNIILKKSSLKALELEEDVNLPLHMPLFSLKNKKDSQ